MKTGNTKYDYAKLNGRITELYGNRTKFSSKTGISYSHVTALLTGKSLFNQHDIILWKECLQIANEELTDYFFTKNGDETQRN